MSDLQEDIFKGATRPSMLAGVPLMPLLLLGGITLLLVFWGGMMISGWVGLISALASIPVYVWMRTISKKDDQRLHQMFLRLKLSIPQRNKGFWRARSYAPVQWRGVKDAFRK